MTSDDLRKEARRIFDTVCVAGRLQLFEEAEHELRHEDGFEDSEYPLDLIESRCVDMIVEQLAISIYKGAGEDERFQQALGWCEPFAYPEA